MRIRNSLRNISSGIVGELVSQSIGFGVRTVFIYKLGAEYLGIGGLFGSILAVLSLAELGIGQAITYSLYRPLATGDEAKVGALVHLYRQVYRLMFVVVMSLGCMAMPLLPLLIKDYGVVPHLDWIYLMFVASISVSYLFSAEKTLLFAAQRKYVMTYWSILFTVVQAMGQIVVLLLTANYFLYLGVQIASELALNIAISMYARRHYPCISRLRYSQLTKAEKGEIKTNVKAMSIYKVGTVALNSTDSIIISKFAGLVAVGLYSNYLLLYTAVNSFLSSIFSGLTASIGDVNARDGEQKRRLMFRVVNSASYILHSSCAVCLCNCMSPFICWWVGDGYLMPESVSIAIMANMYVSGMLFAPYNYRQTMGLFRHGRWRPIVSAVLNIVLSIALVRHWGVAGVLWGTAFTRLLTNAWYDPYIVHKYALNGGMGCYLGDYAVKSLAFVCVCLLCRQLGAWWPVDTLLQIAFLALATMALSLTLLSLVGLRGEVASYLLAVVRGRQAVRD